MAKPLNIPQSLWVFSHQFPITDDACLLLAEQPVLQPSESSLKQMYKTINKKQWDKILEELEILGTISYTQRYELNKYKHIDFGVNFESTSVTPPAMFGGENFNIDYSRAYVFILFPSPGDRLKFELMFKEELPWQQHRANPAKYEI